MKNFSTLSILLIALFTCTIFLSCNDDNEEKGTCTFCGVENPLEDLVWLKQIKEEMANDIVLKSAIYSCSYQEDKEGFIIQWAVNGYALDMKLMDCQGNLIKTCNNSADISDAGIENIQIIYQNFEEIK